MALARARRDGGMNYWPGFVDVLSSFILGIIFLLTVFVFVQFYLTQEVTGKDTALNRLNAQIAQLTELLSLEKTGKLGLEEQLSMLRSSQMAPAIQFFFAITSFPSSLCQLQRIPSPPRLTAPCHYEASCRALSPA